MEDNKLLLKEKMAQGK